MRKIMVRSAVNAPFTTVVSHFNRSLLEALSPDLLRLRILQYDGQLPGNRFCMQLGPSFLGVEWEGVVTASGSTPGTYWFEDVGVRLPFPLKCWKHRHIVRKSEHGTVIIDIIYFSSGFVLLDWFLFPFLLSMFKARTKKYRAFFNS